MLEEKSYKVQKIYPVDIFPYTNHIETAVPTKGRRIYQKNKNYVFEKFGFQVSSLNIAKVKAKHGILERECYNKGKNSHYVPICSQEKEDDIKDAWEYFEML